MSTEIKNQKLGKAGKEHCAVSSAETKPTPESDVDLTQRRFEVREREGKHGIEVYIGEGVFEIAGEIYATVESDDRGLSERRAIAALLAAAPALYAALEATCCRYSRRKVCSSNIVDMCDRCAALALANGQTASEQRG